jgi:uncharacterized membrane protein HdeD (DUF308 family)
METVKLAMASDPQRWWLFAIRGVFAIAFGILCLVAPMPSLVALIILFGIFAILDGASNLVLAARKSQVGGRWPALIVSGLASIVAGVLALVWPTLSALALLMVIAAWSIVTGVMSIVAAIRLRKEIHNEWLLVLNGLLSIAFGVLVLLFPGAGALALVVWIGAYAIVSGALLLWLAFKVRSRTRHEPTPTHVPAPA